MANTAKIRSSIIFHWKTHAHALLHGPIGMLTTKIIEKKTLIILGSGCAGLTAAIYTARAALRPLVIDGNQPGGQLTTTTDIENFPGFPDGIGGYDLVERMRKQAERFGATFASDYIHGMRREGDVFFLEGTSTTYEARAIIVATGASPYLLGVPGETEYFGGKGVSVCATCDGAFYRGKEVAVIGGGDSAVEEAIFLTRFCPKVYIIHRRDSLRASVPMIKKVMEKPKVQIIWDSVLAEILGDGRQVTGLRIHNVKTDAEQILACSGVFIAVGHKPNSNFAAGVLPLDSKGYFVAQPDDASRSPVDGVFLAGDCADSLYQQAVIAAGAGARAAIAAERWLTDKL
ncbi:MAG: thioredoxin-disulfide reductase [Puniceicoccales bacterium]|nr:thioredoxin-disulfide reductase [Puniceicoccales bacterium]